MITIERIRQRDKSTQNKEEKVNTRKALVICVLVVGLASALQITALAAPPSVEYRPGVNAIYRGYGYNVAPKVSAPVYYFSDCKPPIFHRGWTSTPNAPPKPWQPHPGLLSNMYVVPEVRVPRY